MTPFTRSPLCMLLVLHAIILAGVCAQNELSEGLDKIQDAINQGNAEIDQVKDGSEQVKDGIDTVKNFTEGILRDAEAVAQDIEEGVCFPARAKVTLKNGLMKTMAELNIGDMVAVGRGKYSQVFLFTHASPDTTHVFVTLTTDAGQHIALTPSHHLYVNGALEPAANVIVGDVLELGDGSMSTVAHADIVVDTGLYNPQTLHGDIVVGGVRASTYTNAVNPTLAHSLLAPLRAVYEYAQASCGVFVNGSPALVRLLSAK